MAECKSCAALKRDFNRLLKTHNGLMANCTSLRSHIVQQALRGSQLVELLIGLHSEDMKELEENLRENLREE